VRAGGGSGTSGLVTYDLSSGDDDAGFPGVEDPCQGRLIMND
jgi:hypothetical protein